MRNIKKITGTLNVIKRLPLSNMGNPKYRVEINNEIFETKTNASLGYSITNFDNKKVIASYEFNNSTYKPKSYLVDVKKLYDDDRLNTLNIGSSTFNF